MKRRPRKASREKKKARERLEMCVLAFCLRARKNTSIKTNHPRPFHDSTTVEDTAERTEEAQIRVKSAAFFFLPASVLNVTAEAKYRPEIPQSYDSIQTERTTEIACRSDHTENGATKLRTVLVQ